MLRISSLLKSFEKFFKNNCLECGQKSFEKIGFIKVFEEATTALPVPEKKSANNNSLFLHNDEIFYRTRP
jgi:hypothetical protein